MKTLIYSITGRRLIGIYSLKTYWLWSRNIRQMDCCWIMETLGQWCLLQISRKCIGQIMMVNQPTLIKISSKAEQSSLTSRVDTTRHVLVISILILSLSNYVRLYGQKPLNVSLWLKCGGRLATTNLVNLISLKVESFLENTNCPSSSLLYLVNSCIGMAVSLTVQNKMLIFSKAFINNLDRVGRKVVWWCSRLLPIAGLTLLYSTKEALGLQQMSCSSLMTSL